MRKLLLAVVITAVFSMLFILPLQAQNVAPMFGGVLIDGYNPGKDSAPRGTILYDGKKNLFKGSYFGLKMPKGRKAIFAWVHNTKNGESTYIGPVGWLKRKPTHRNNRARFSIKLPRRFQGGNFGENEIIGFSAEKTLYIGYKNGRPMAKTRPRKPAGSSIMKFPNPAFFLFAKLPGADTDLHYCGHGQDFFYAKDLNKQTCYD
ncbi:MAG: hypothetical protein IIC13_14310 [SAR324 cluster bacterium]|nr:hypothetical protein [SAR324 cluster bacterium]